MNGMRANRREEEGERSTPTARAPMEKKAMTSMKAEARGTAERAHGAENTPTEMMGSVLVFRVWMTDAECDRMVESYSLHAERERRALGEQYGSLE